MDSSSHGLTYRTQFKVLKLNLKEANQRNYLRKNKLAGQGFTGIENH